METTAANNGQKKKLALKSQDADTDGLDRRYSADPAENQTPSYSAEVELEGNEVNPWPYIHALLCSVSCVCLGRPN